MWLQPDAVLIVRGTKSMCNDCGYSHFNNCGTKKPQDDYCLFHKSSKTRAERKEFYTKIKNRNSVREERDRALGTLGMSTHTRFVFEDSVDFRGYHFPKIPFGQSRSLVFGFGRAIFESTTDFSYASFYNPVFSRAIFKSDVSFKGAIFFNAEFEGASFRGVANFNGATFEGKISFHLSTFFESARFLTSDFSGPANFSGTSFQSECLFMGSSFQKSLSFSGAEFNHGITILPVDNEYLQSGPFGVDVNESERFQRNDALREACRVQRISFEDRGLAEEADQMYLRERRAYRRHRAANSIKGKVHAISEAVLADLTSRYGTSWIRVIGISILAITACSIIYGVVDVFVPSFGEVTYSTSNPPIAKPWLYLYFSVVTFTTLGFGDVSATGNLALLSAGQALTGALMMALIIAVFARQWMRS